MIRSIAFELFDRLTTDPDALRKQVAKARADRDAVETELLGYKCGTRAHAANATAQELAQLTAERDALQFAVTELQAQLELARARVAQPGKGTDLTIEPTWILAAWSVSGSEWAEVKRGSYDAMLADMRRDATSWNLFSRSNWDALVKNGRAR